MLRFFRQIRQRLLTQNEFSKYLLYGIGEILLVVIGILIALQVDNWNEDRKEKELYLTYLFRLQSDYDSLLSQLQEARSFNEELVELANYQIDFLEGRIDELDTVKLAIAMEFNAGINRYNTDIPTVSELLSSGRLTLIRNDSLKAMLVGQHQYNLRRKSENAEWENWHFDYRKRVRDILEKQDKVNIDLNWQSAYPDHPNWKDYELVTDGKEITDRLLHVPKLTGLLKDILVARIITSFLLQYEIETSKEQLRLIKSEIDRIN